MSAQDNIKLVEDMRAAAQSRDEERYLSFWADDAVSRTAGVPRALGGVIQGKEARRESFRNNPPAQGAETRVQTAFADDNHVCLVQRVTAPFNGTQYFKGSGRPFTTYECLVYDIEGAHIKGSTAYINFLDVYVQTGLVDVGQLRK